MKNMCIIIMLLTTIFIPNVVGEYNISGNDENNQYTEKLTTYRVFIDQHYGFYRIYYANVSGKVVQVPYNGTLNIHEGDTVTWINDAEDGAFTIISEQELWKGYDAYLKWAYKQFSYTFNKSGTFTIYIRQYSKFRQKVIVGSRLDSKPNSNIISDSEYLNSEYNGTTNGTTKVTTIMANKTDVLNTSISSTKSNLVSSPGSNLTNELNEKGKLDETNSLGINMSKDNLQTTGSPGGPIIYMSLSLALIISSFVYVFRKNKDKLLSIILISSIFLLTNPFGNVASAYTSIHPNMFLNQNDIDIIKNKIDNNDEPWKTAYQRLISDADSALNVPIQSVTYGGKVPPSGDKHDYYSESAYTTDGVFDPNADRTDYNSAMTIGKSVRDLGLAYVFTKDSRYADKAIQLIRAWAIDPTTKMNPKFTNFNGQAYAELTLTMSSTYYGADLIWNYPGWSSSDKQIFQSWVRDLSISRGRVKEYDPAKHLPSNYMNWQIVFISASAVITEDSSDLDWAFQYWRELVDQQMDSQGRMINDNWRTRGLFYSLFAVNAMLQSAEIARHQGVDLYNYKTSDGRGLELTLDYHASYAAGKVTWPYQEINPPMVEYALYELAYSFKQKPSYMEVIGVRGRPMYENRIMGPVTLTHVNNFGIIVSPTPGTPGPTSPTPGPTSPKPGKVFTISCYKIAKGTTPTPVPTQTVPNPTYTPGPTPTYTPGGDIDTWKYNDVIIIPYGRLHSNAWGMTDAEKQSNIVKMHMYYKYNGNFGWEWYRPDPTPDPNDYPTPIYPEIIVGASGPFTSLIPDFPITLKDINYLTTEINYNYTKSPTGGYNLAYDIWFVDGAGTKKAEFMLWIQGNLGDSQTIVSDGINEYKYYYRTKGSWEWPWDYHAFVLRDQYPVPLNHKVDMKKLFDILIDSGKVDPNWNMLGIELGNEIGSGSGRIDIDKFLINMNGNDIGKK